MNHQFGWEKENGENKVDYLCRNELVSIPEFDSIEEENRLLLSRCNLDMQRENYDRHKNRFISELFEEHKKHFFFCFQWHLTLHCIQLHELI